MDRRLILVPTLLAVIGFDQLSAQAPPEASFALKKCDEPKVAIGALPRATGAVTFRLAKDGKPDTASLAVTKVLGLSVAGFRSVVSSVVS